MRRGFGIAAAVTAGLAVAAGAGLWLYRRLGRTDPVLELTAGPAGDQVDEVSDEPLARETRFDEELHQEERQRHEAAERLKADPLTERLDNDDA